MATLLDPQVTLAVLATFCLSLIVKSILGEYVKRLWFNRIEPALRRYCRFVASLFRRKEISAAEAALRQALAEMERERDDLRNRLEALLTERESLMEEVMRLRVSVGRRSARRTAS